MDNDPAEEEKVVPQEVLLAWSSPSRLFKRRNKEYYTNAGAIVFLAVVILIFAREYLLIAAVVSIMFLVYVLSTVPPEDVNHRITNLGLESAGHFYRWEELVEFWFEEQWGQTMLELRPIVGTRIIVLLGGEDKAEVRKLITKYIPFREQPEKSWVDNAAHWITEKIPLEKPS